MRKNKLLAALPDEEFACLQSRLEHSSLNSGQVLHEPGEPIRHMFFPNDAVISMLMTSENGMTSEVGMVGRHGMTGLPVVTGAASACYRAVVLLAGSAWSIQSEAFRKLCSERQCLHDMMLRYLQALYNQLVELVACTRMHTTDARLCRWLLMVHDRAASDDLPLTHEVVSEMLGVRREAVTLATVKLQRAGIIKNRRGHITILDRRCLEQHACQCYRLMKDELDQLLGH